MIHGIVSIFIVVIVMIIYGEIRKFIIKRKLFHFDSPKQIPILGVAGRLLGTTNNDLIEIIFKMYNEVKSTPFQVWFGPILVIGISEPKDIQVILNNDNCLNKPYFYHQFNCNTSIIATEKKIWKPHRRALNSAFNVKILQSNLTFLNEKSRILINKMEPYLNQPGDLYRTIFICMMDMITITTMGVEMTLQSDRGQFLYGIAKQIMNNMQYRVSRFWLRWDFIYSMTKSYRDEMRWVQDGNNFIEELYEKRSSNLKFLLAHGIDYLKEAKDKNNSNFLEKCLILEQIGVFSHENVLDQMRVIILAGMDTSSIAIFGTLLMLAINQKHQDLVVEELRSILDSSNCDVTQDHLVSMQYMERVIKESMRLLTPVPFIGRTPSTDFESPKELCHKVQWCSSILCICIGTQEFGVKMFSNSIQIDFCRKIAQNNHRSVIFRFRPAQETASE